MKNQFPKLTTVFIFVRQIHRLRCFFKTLDHISQWNVYSRMIPQGELRNHTSNHLHQSLKSKLFLIKTNVVSTKGCLTDALFDDELGVKGASLLHNMQPVPPLPNAALPKHITIGLNQRVSTE